MYFLTGLLLLSFTTALSEVELSSLLIEGTNTPLQFDPTIYFYELEIDPQTDSLTLTANLAATIEDPQNEIVLTQYIEIYRVNQNLIPYDYKRVSSGDQITFSPLADYEEFLIVPTAVINKYDFYRAIIQNSYIITIKKRVDLPVFSSVEGIDNFNENTREYDLILPENQDNFILNPLVSARASFEGDYVLTPAGLTTSTSVEEGYQYDFTDVNSATILLFLGGRENTENMYAVSVAKETVSSIPQLAQLQLELNDQQAEINFSPEKNVYVFELTEDQEEATITFETDPENTVFIYSPNDWPIEVDSTGIYTFSLDPQNPTEVIIQLINEEEKTNNAYALRFYHRQSPEHPKLSSIEENLANDLSPLFDEEQRHYEIEPTQEEYDNRQSERKIVQIQAQDNAIVYAPSSGELQPLISVDLSSRWSDYGSLVEPLVVRHLPGNIQSSVRIYTLSSIREFPNLPPEFPKLLSLELPPSFSIIPSFDPEVREYVITNLEGETEITFIPQIEEGKEINLELNTYNIIGREPENGELAREEMISGEMKTFSLLHNQKEFQIEARSVINGVGLGSTYNFKIETTKNHPPQIENMNLIISEDTQIVNMVIPAYDFDGESVSIIIQDQPEHGQIEIINQGLWTRDNEFERGFYPTLNYKPDSQYFGEDSFTYVGTDGELESEPATVTITVESINDEPIAEDFSFYTFLGETYRGIFPINDVEQELLNLELSDFPDFFFRQNMDSPLIGSLVITPPQESNYPFTYIPSENLDEMSIDTAYYRVTDSEGLSSSGKEGPNGFSPNRVTAFILTPDNPSQGSLLTNLMINNEVVSNFDPLVKEYTLFVDINQETITIDDAGEQNYGGLYVLVSPTSKVQGDSFNSVTEPITNLLVEKGESTLFLNLNGRYKDSEDHALYTFKIIRTGRILGNQVDITTEGITNIQLKIGNRSVEEITPADLLSVQSVEFFSGDKLLLRFNHDFGESNLDLRRISINQSTQGIIVNLDDQLQEGKTKTVFLDNNNFVGLCVKDADVASLAEVSPDCTEENEYNFNACLTNSGETTINGITCSITEGTITIDGLRNSAILGTISATPPNEQVISNDGGNSGSSSSGGGRGGRGNTECNDNIDNDNDGSTDLSDEGCSNANDDSEENPLASKEEQPQQNNNNPLIPETEPAPPTNEPIGDTSVTDTNFGVGQAIGLFNQIKSNKVIVGIGIVAIVSLAGIALWKRK